MIVHCCRPILTALCCTLTIRPTTIIGTLQVVWNGTVGDPAVDTNTSSDDDGQGNLNHDHDHDHAIVVVVVWLGHKCHEYIETVCAGTGTHWQ